MGGHWCRVEGGRMLASLAPYGTADKASAQAKTDLKEAAGHRSDIEPDSSFA